jgi:hypothetical protein
MADMPKTTEERILVCVIPSRQPGGTGGKGPGQRLILGRAVNFPGLSFLRLCTVPGLCPHRAHSIPSDVRESRRKPMSRRGCDGESRVANVLPSWRWGH